MLIRLAIHATSTSRTDRRTDLPSQYRTLLSKRKRAVKYSMADAVSCGAICRKERRCRDAVLVRPLYYVMNDWIISYSMRRVSGFFKQRVLVVWFVVLKQLFFRFFTVLWGVLQKFTVYFWKGAALLGVSRNTAPAAPSPNTAISYSE